MEHFDTLTYENFGTCLCAQSKGKTFKPYYFETTEKYQLVRKFLRRYGVASEFFEYECGVYTYNAYLIANEYSIIRNEEFKNDFRLARVVCSQCGRDHGDWAIDCNEEHKRISWEIEDIKSICFDIKKRLAAINDSEGLVQTNDLVARMMIKAGLMV